MNFIVMRLEGHKGYNRLAVSMDYKRFVTAKEMDYSTAAYTG